MVKRVSIQLKSSTGRGKLNVNRGQNKRQSDQTLFAAVLLARCFGMSRRVLLLFLVAKACVGSDDDDDAIAVDCTMGRWSAWGSCDGDGKQWRTRQIMIPPRFGGKPCQELTSSRACVEAPPARRKKHRGKGYGHHAGAKGPSWLHTSTQPASCHMTHPRWHYCHRHGGCCSDKTCVKNCDFSIYDATSPPTPKPSPAAPLPTPIPNPNHLPAWALKLQQRGVHAGKRTPSPTPESNKHRLERLTDMNYRSGSQTDIQEGDYVILVPPISLEMAKGPLKTDQVGVVDLVDSEVEADKNGVKVRSPATAPQTPCASR